QQGSYRFTAKASLPDRLTDRAGNPLGAAAVRNFTIAPLSPYIIEGRSDNSFATATSLSTTPSSVPDGSFAVYFSRAVGSNPYSIAQGDFNADGHLDLAVVNYNSANVSLLRGNGDGTFQAPVNIATPNNPIDVVAVDLNADGKIDLITSNQGSNSISVFKGIGDGTFAARVDYGVGSSPRGLAVGDFNNDGKLDVVVANTGSGNVSVRLGNGDGTLQALVNYTAGSAPEAVAVADYDGDGDLDLAAANFNSDTVSLLLGNNAGAFAAATNLSAGGDGPNWITSADFDGDAKPDLAVVNYNSATVTVLRNLGGASFGTPVVYSGVGNSYDIDAADLNADGRPDLIVSNYNNDRLRILQNKGDGTFGAVVTYNPGGNPIAAAVGDYNEDGRPDIATANHGNSTMSVLLGNAVKVLLEDPSGSGLRSGFGRGNLSIYNVDEDYWSFTAKAGDRLTVAAEVPGSPNQTGLRYDVYGPEGTFLGRFYADQFGRGELAPITLPSSGSYYVGVYYNYGYEGEYRLRVTLATPPVQLETEANDSTSSATVPTLAQAPGSRLIATAAGYLSVVDGAGDYYLLGNFAAGATVE
ncbi:MAG TPA: VCBS repeat-containing protein, partial [Reyranella sp.]|nr:VCBS repeat-containing protein [Reyranella sp.]